MPKHRPAPKHRRRRDPQGRALVALGTATVAAVVGVPGPTSAEPTRNINEVRRQVDHLYHEAELITERANELEDDMVAMNRRVRSLTGGVARQEKRVQAMRRQIGEFAAAEYRTGGRLDPTVQVFIADSPADYLAQMTTLKALSRQQADLLRRFQDEQSDLTERRAVLGYELDELRMARDETDERRKAALRNAARAQAILDRLTAEERRRLEEAERRRQARLRASRAEERSTPSPTPTPTRSPSPTPTKSPSPTPTKSPSPTPTPSPTPDRTRGEIALAFARDQLGEPYVYGADGPDSWDCSGLTMKAWEAAGVSLPHSSSRQYDSSPKVARSNLRPGDLVFYYSDLHHVGLYAGDGKVLHAPKPGDNVEYINIDYMPYAGATRPG
ncbi:NlpC/P60 family protein [Actinopolymorpha sp. B17G11]|uniref:C40 family peptidase n=1 Tax=unclassified Actinopolymorpha TaxID=2627063 RepID=UPI0032D92428